MNFYKRHIGDYLKDTAHLTLLEHGVYTRLLDVYYTRESGIPDAQAARLIGARGRDETAALKVVLGEFFELIDGSWVQSRCEREIEEASAQAKANRENGKKGGRPKKVRNPEENESESEVKPTGNPSGFDSLTEKNLSQTPDSISQTPDKTTGSVIASAASARAARDDSTVPTSHAEWCRYFADEHGVELNASNVHHRSKAWPLFTAWIKAGVSIAQMDRACQKARDESKGAIAFLPAYADSVLASMDRPAAPAREDASQRRARISKANGDAWLAESPESDPNVIDMEH